mgnify:CR=1 FL=1
MRPHNIIAQPSRTTLLSCWTCMFLNLFGCFFSSAEKKKEEVVFRFAWRYREMCLKLIRAEGKLASGIWWFFMNISLGPFLH